MEILLCNNIALSYNASKSHLLRIHTQVAGISFILSLGMPSPILRPFVRGWSVN
jgi:hypothetical protein